MHLPFKVFCILSREFSRAEAPIYHHFQSASSCRIAIPRARKLRTRNLDPQQLHQLDMLPGRIRRKCTWSYLCHTLLCGVIRQVLAPTQLWLQMLDKLLHITCKQCIVPHQLGSVLKRAHHGTLDSEDPFPKDSEQCATRNRQWIKHIILTSGSPAAQIPKNIGGQVNSVENRWL